MWQREKELRASPDRGRKEKKDRESKIGETERKRPKERQRERPELMEVLIP